MGALAALRRFVAGWFDGWTTLAGCDDPGFRDPAASWPNDLDAAA